MRDWHTRSVLGFASVVTNVVVGSQSAIALHTRSDVAVSGARSKLPHSLHRNGHRDEATLALPDDEVQLAGSSWAHRIESENSQRGSGMAVEFAVTSGLHSDIAVQTASSVAFADRS